MLLAALTTFDTDIQPLIDAVYWLESSYYLEVEDGSRVPSSLLKNVGLAHVHLIQNPILAKLVNPKRIINNLPKPSIDYFKTLDLIEWPYKDNEE